MVKHRDLNALPGDAERIAYEKKDLEKQTLALRCFGYERFSDGDRPGKTETEDGQSLKEVCECFG